MNLKNNILEAIQKILEIFNYLFTSNLNEKRYLKNKLLKHENIVIFDVGANLGTYSDKVQKIFSNKKVFLHLFEPNKYLIKNLSSKFSGHSINEVAISDFNSESDLYINSISSQSSLIEDNSFIGEEVEKIIVNTIRLDKYIVEKQIEKINLLKLDVEGYELNSLKSLGEYLNQENIEIIKVEIHFQKGDNFGSINEILNKNGFYLDGFTNTKYLKGEILFVDAYYSAKGLN
jgi:FkbM family methyltransferase